MNKNSIIKFGEGIIICFIFSIFFLLIPFLKVSADLVNTSFTGPTSNTITTDQINSINFSFTFKVPILTSAPVAPNDRYSIWFQPTIDGVPVLAGVGKARYIYDESKITAQDRTLTYNWNDPTYHPFGSKIYKWTLYDKNKTTGAIGKIYVDTSFTYKLNTNYKGFYYIYKKQSAAKPDENYYSRSDKYADLITCSNAWTTFKIQNPTAIEFTPCQEYNYLPPVLNNDAFVPITPIVTTTNSDVYTLLAPIGEFKVAPKNIGDYFNTIFTIAIGLCGALAVIMIVIGGVQYMGDESIFGKTEAKSKITSAILGLLIALGSYALLNTINPDLLGGKGVNIAQVSAEIEEETEPLVSNDNFTSGEKTEKCSGGIFYANTINGNIPTCTTLKNKVEKLISDANKDGYKIFGYGYRSKQKQEKLRSENCGGNANIYNVNAKCKPLTAYPGKSMHENGLAIDFTCDGSTIRSRDNKCFIWLQKNALSNGFINLQKEPWHWSTNGH